MAAVEQKGRVDARPFLSALRRRHFCMLPRDIHLEIHKGVFDATRSEGYSHSLFASGVTSTLSKFTY